MTRKILIAAALLIAATVAPVIATAQNLPPGKWWQRPEIVQRLELTADQRERLDDVFRTAADGLIDAKGAVEKLQIALRGELDRQQVRRADVLRIAGQLGEARARLFDREITMLLDMRGVLTDQQWSQIREFLDRPRPMNDERRPMNDGGNRRPNNGPGRVQPPRGGRRP